MALFTALVALNVYKYNRKKIDGGLKKLIFTSRVLRYD